MRRPPWWRPFARRRWARQETVAVGDSPPPDEILDRFRLCLKRRSTELRRRLDHETDCECVDADTQNGIPFWTISRAMRNRDGEQ